MSDYIQNSRGRFILNLALEKDQNNRSIVQQEEDSNMEITIDSNSLLANSELNYANIVLNHVDIPEPRSPQAGCSYMNITKLSQNSDPSFLHRQNSYKLNNSADTDVELITVERIQ